ncbi:MAG: hypothetical protein E7393_03920 [Ruminococcaceae bacterium]|nr:hypothetical protein [Oscillospiraceae bacterium]
MKKIQQKIFAAYSDGNINLTLYIYFTGGHGFKIKKILKKGFTKDAICGKIKEISYKMKVNSARR